METVLGVLVIIIAAAIFGVVLNPYFWQGFRNTKFWDEQKRSRRDISNKNLIDPNNKDL